MVEGTGCVEWTGAKTNGYGVISFGTGSGGKRSTAYAHRLSWEIHNGPIPDGLQILHDCDNPSCVNVDHLFLGTNAENHNDKVNKGRQVRGERSHLSKLTEEIVLAIRKDYATGRYSQNDLADKYNTTGPNVHHVVTRKSWKHV